MNRYSLLRCGFSVQITDVKASKVIFRYLKVIWLSELISGKLKQIFSKSLSLVHFSVCSNGICEHFLLGREQNSGAFSLHLCRCSIEEEDQLRNYYHLVPGIRPVFHQKLC